VLAILVNCRQNGNKLLCGAAVFKGGLSGNIKVYDISDPSVSFTIKVPESVAIVATTETFADYYDSFELLLV
jgi:hypothetical protein